MRVAIYCRVSTGDKGQDNANQLLQLQEFGSRHAVEVGFPVGQDEVAAAVECVAQEDIDANQ